MQWPDSVTQYNVLVQHRLRRDAPVRRRLPGHR